MAPKNVPENHVPGVASGSGGHAAVSSSHSYSLLPVAYAEMAFV